MKLTTRVNIESNLISKGYVEPSNDRFHCVIKLKNELSICGYELIQSHGDTVLESILTAINDSISLLHSEYKMKTTKNGYSDGGYMAIISHDYDFSFFGKAKTAKGAREDAIKKYNESKKALLKSLELLLKEFESSDGDSFEL